MKVGKRRSSVRDPEDEDHIVLAGKFIIRKPL
jgi:hypothetical protein